MTTVRFMITPGSGYKETEVSAGTTVADLVASEDLHGRQIQLNGQVVQPEDFASTVVSGAFADLWAVKGVKGA